MTNDGVCWSGVAFADEKGSCGCFISATMKAVVAGWYPMDSQEAIEAGAPKTQAAQGRRYELMRKAYVVDR